MRHQSQSLEIVITKGNAAESPGLDSVSLNAQPRAFPLVWKLVKRSASPCQDEGHRGKEDVLLTPTIRSACL